MPELPEVQTVVSDLNRKIKGDTIVGFWSDWGRAIKNRSVEHFTQEIKGRNILGVRRIGKNIFIDLSGGKTIYLHLKMTGHLLIKSQISNLKSQKYFSERVNQYIHHIFYLNREKSIEFSDLRKFGKIVLLETGKEKENKEINSLGVDAMSETFTLERLAEILGKKKNKKIRDILMDQTLIAGIGNIYVSEILFDAKISPARSAKKIAAAEQKKLYNGIKKVLEKAIKLRGTSDSDYRDTDGAPGGFQKVLRVYRREGEKCRRCGTIVKREKMGQRSAFFCPKCQI